MTGNRGTATEALLEYQRQTESLEQVAQLVDWDQETFMPAGAAEQRSEWRGALEEVIHSRRISSEFAELLEAAVAEADDRFALACLRRLKRERDRAIRVPAELPPAIARTSSRAIHAWQEARRRNETGLFLPLLGELVRLRREEANALQSTGDAYEALLDIHEAGATTGWLDEMFGRLRAGLVGLRERIGESSRQIPALDGRFPRKRQLKLARELASRFGIDWSRGRLDRSVHPFTSGAGNDVRITTRVSTTDPFNCLYSTIHEAGHAVYEQNVSQEYLLTPLGKGVSFGVHESQSRMFENQLGRSRAFTGWLFGRMTELFGRTGIPDADAFHGAVNRVCPGHIRTEADEVQYNLHIMLRYELERDLINGQLDVAGLEEAWNRAFLADFGFAVDRPSNGVLQDIHWAAGYFGYFPTYAIGNIYAGCMHEVMRGELPGLDRQLRSGDPGDAVAWLCDRVHRHGSFLEPADLVEGITGAPATEAPLLGYLEKKFGEIYDF